MNKTKVLHIITHLPVGGAQDNTLITVEDLDRSKYDVHLLCGQSGEWMERAEAIADLSLIYNKFLVRPIHIIYDCIATFQMIALMKKEKYDVVHTHSSKPGFIGRLAAKMAGVPIIVHTIHGFPFHDFMPKWVQLFYIKLEQWASVFSNKLITVSNLNLKKAVELKIAPTEKFVNIYSGIRFEKFQGCKDPVRKKEEINLPVNKKIIGMVGRLSEQKAPQLFIEAIPQIVTAYPDCHFILVGDGELRPKLEKMVKALRIESFVSFPGFRHDVSEILSILDVFVLSSIYEGLGRSLTEAMYMKRPVIATAVEGVPELVENEKTGFLIPPLNVAEISEKVLKFLLDPKLAAEYGENAHQKVVHLFAAEKMVEEIDQLYQTMIK